jgi:hypothetical protein
MFKSACKNSTIIDVVKTIIVGYHENCLFINFYSNWAASLLLQPKHKSDPMRLGECPHK